MAQSGDMEMFAAIAVIVVVLYAYAYWRMFRDERPRFAPASHFRSGSIAEGWERVTAGWSRQRPM